MQLNVLLKYELSLTTYQPSFVITRINNIILFFKIFIISSIVAPKDLPHGSDATMKGAVQVQNRKSIKSSLIQTTQSNK